MRELTNTEVECVSAAGLSSGEAGVVSSVFAAGATMTGSFALVPGPHTPVAAAISGVMALGASVFGLYSASTS